jgi:hypothetical protein
MVNRKLVAVLIAVVLIAGIMPYEAFAAPGEVRVSLPGFNVTLNGVRVDNGYRKYPLIVYRDITYFPMTYFDCRFLGIETRWDAKSGLDIERTGITGAYRDYRGDAKNAAVYTAAIPSFDVRLNGKAVDNAGEEYPLLVFRDVTYFPMTWKFCVEELGWDYEFSAADGLVINSPNQRLQKHILTDYVDGQVIVSDGHFYYGGAEGAIYQAPVANPTDTKKIYQLPIWWPYGDGKTYVFYGLSQINGEAWLKYHQGGAAMGTDFFIRLNPNGTAEEVDRGYLAFKTFGDITVKVDQWSPPVHDNLMVKKDGQEEYRRVGNPYCLYGWDYELREDGSQGGSPSEDIYLVGDTVYVLAVDTTKETDGSGIYSVSIDTDAAKRISDLRVNSFTVHGDAIYALSNGDLYQLTLDGGSESLLETKGPVSREFDFHVLGGAIYYVNADDNRLYAVGKDQSINPYGRVNGLKTEEDYLVCTFNGESGDPYRVMVLDRDGSVVFRSSDTADINTVSVEDGRVYYMESTEGAVYSAELGSLD